MNINIEATMSVRTQKLSNFTEKSIPIPSLYKHEELISQMTPCISSGTNIVEIIQNASSVLFLVWPASQFIASNPLRELESLPFNEAIYLAESYFSKEPKKNQIDACVNHQMIKWCQAYCDLGQALIPMPEREKGFYQACLDLLQLDTQIHKNDQNLKNWLAKLPSSSERAIEICLDKLHIAHEKRLEYLRHTLLLLPGWGGYIKWRQDWSADTHLHPLSLIDFLAIRLIVTCAVTGLKSEHVFQNCLIPIQPRLDLKNIEKNEEIYQESLLKKINIPKEEPKSPDAQLVFCIDVRSEPFRKKIEAEGNFETFGFAGFFGIPVAIETFHHQRIIESCPVLISSLHKVEEHPVEKYQRKAFRHQKGQNFLEKIHQIYQCLKYNFASPFALAETLGIWSGIWMGIHTFFPFLTKKFKHLLLKKILPISDLETTLKIDHIPSQQQLQYAENFLRSIGLTKNFGKLILLCGHGSTTQNNAYGSSLDCGACGGHRGGSNAKSLAAVLNSEWIRKELKNKGIDIPIHSLFLGAEHDTTLDSVKIYSQTVSSQNHKAPLKQLRDALERASEQNRIERCSKLGFSGNKCSVSKHVFIRSCDWAQVRPEWGLARNAAFIVGPRALSKKSELEGRCFLHSYDWKEDVDGKFLEVILTAPMVVAQWINAQYFFSTTYPDFFSSGSKVTQNIVGKFGVMQGNASDLKHGLPLQSVFATDRQPYHDPMRLLTLVYAPKERVEHIIEKHSILQNLFYNHWMHLLVIDSKMQKTFRLTNKNDWKQIQ